MGIKERKQKEREELRTMILEAAKALFISHGVANTSIRNIAEQIEYSPATIYLYFKDKDDILHALHSEGFRELGNRMQILQAVSDPLERLKALGRVYLDFAHQNAEMYELMFIAKAPMDYLDKTDEEQWQEGKRAFDFLKNTVAACIEKGHFKGHQSGPLSFLIWSSVHGMVALHVSDRCKGISEEDPEVVFEGAFQSLIKIFDSI
jgi:AcrR family transcriptional regulator